MFSYENWLIKPIYCALSSTPKEPMHYDQEPHNTTISILSIPKLIHTMLPYQKGSELAENNAFLFREHSNTRS